MKDILFLLVVGLSLYIMSRVILKEPILPWKQKKEVVEGPKKSNKKSKGKKDIEDPLEEVEAAPFKELFDNVYNIENHMIRQKNNTFTMIAEVQLVNYYLLDQEEQESIDAIFETWLAQLAYPVRIYLQNRFVDLTKPIHEIQSIMEKEDDLHPLAKQYGQSMIDSLRSWQSERPRYETKSFLIFDYAVDVREIKADDEEEFEEKLINKAFDELYRRMKTATTQLRKANMEVQMPTTDGICEVLYYGFNRRKAVTNHYSDIEKHEQLALYVTADQTPSHIVRVKGEIENVQKDSPAEEDNEKAEKAS